MSLYTTMKVFLLPILCIILCLGPQVLYHVDATPTQVSALSCPLAGILPGTNVTCTFKANALGGTADMFSMRVVPENTLQVKSPELRGFQQTGPLEFKTWFVPLYPGKVTLLGFVNGVSSIHGELTIPVDNYDAPVVFSFTPLDGNRCLRTTVTITGINFGPTPSLITSITVRGRPCESYTWQSPTTIVCVALGADSPGPVYVGTTIGGDNSTSPMGVVGENIRPIIDLLTPASAPAQVPTEVLIGGRHFGANVSVLAGITFAGVPCTDVKWQSSQLVKCVTPRFPGMTRQVAVVVQTHAVCAPQPSSVFFSFDGPSIVSVGPNISPLEGDTSVTIRGSGFGSSIDDVSDILIAGISCIRKAFWLSPAELRCLTSATDTETGGPVTVITVQGGTGSGGNFKYIDFNSTGASLDLFSVVERVEPAVGDTEGGTLVTIFGRNFGTSAAELTDLRIGDKKGTDWVWLSRETILFRTPRSRPGTYLVYIEITSSRGKGSSKAYFTYEYSGPLLVTVNKVTATESQVNDPAVATLRLATPPLLDVVASFESLTPKVCTPHPSTLTFTSNNFDREQILNVRAVADFVRAGNRTCTIQVNVVSGDKDLDDLLLPSVSFVSLDALPLVTAVRPPSLPSTGGNITFVGHDFADRVRITIGEANCTNYRHWGTTAPVANGGSANSTAPTQGGGGGGQGSGTVIPSAPPATPTVPGASNTSTSTPGPSSAPSTGSGSNGTLLYIFQEGSDESGAGTPTPTPDPGTSASATPTPSPSSSPSPSPAANPNQPLPPLTTEELGPVLHITCTIPAGLREGYHKVTVINEDKTSQSISDIYYTSNLCPAPNTYFELESEECQECAPGGICRGGGTIWPKAGNWNPNENIGKVAECKPPERCLGCEGFERRTQCYIGEKGSPCAEGYFGDMCAACMPDWYSTTGICKPCPVGDPNTIFALTLISFWLIFGLCAIFVETDENLFIAASFILFVQSMSSMSPLFSSRVPDWARDIYSFFYLSAADATTFRLACYGYESFHLRFAIRIILLLLIGLPMHMLANIGFALSEWWNADEPKAAIDEREAHYANRKVRNYFVHVHMLYYGMTQVCTNVLGCRQLFSELRLIGDTSVLCFEGFHYLVFIGAFPLLLAVTLGYPLFNWWIIRQPKFNDDTAEGVTFRAKFGFATEPFRPELRNMFLFDLAVRCASAVAAGSLSEHPVAQMITVAPITLAWGVVAVVTHAYRHPAMNWITLASSVINVFGVILAFLSKKGGSDSTLDFMSMISVGGMICVTCIAMYFSAYYLLFKWVPREEIEVEAAFDKGFDEIFKLLTVHDGTGAEGGPGALPEGEQWQLDQVLDMQELMSGVTGGMQDLMAFAEGVTGMSSNQQQAAGAAGAAAIGHPPALKKGDAASIGDLSEDELEKEIEITISDDDATNETM